MAIPQIIRRSAPLPDCGDAIVAGADEAGRGALAGPVVAAAVVFDKRREIQGCADSKTLTAARRAALSQTIKDKALAWAVARADVDEIEAHNVLHATMRAMARAVASLAVKPDIALIDGNRAPDMKTRSCAIISGDARVAVISAASILAKVARDEEMISLHALYPHYHFDAHKGYGTRRHLQALRRHGRCPIHRKGWKSVRRCAEQSGLEFVGRPGA